MLMGGPGEEAAGTSRCRQERLPCGGSASRSLHVAELDIAKLRAAAAEFGYWPATTDDEHLAKLRADNRRFDRMNAHDPQGLKWQKMGPRSGGRRHD